MTARRVLFENVMNSYPGTTREEFTDIQFYCGRVLPDSISGDVVILLSDCEADYEVVRRHYEQVGLRDLASEVVFTNEPTSIDLSRWSNHELSPFLVNDEMLRWGGERIRSLAEAVTITDDKNWAVRVFQECGIPHPDTICFEAGGIETLAQFDGPRIFKPAKSATSLGQHRVNDLSDLLAKADPVYLAGSFQLQQPINVAGEGSVQSRIVSGQPQIIMITGQYVGSGGHCGNFFPLAGIKDVAQLRRDALTFLRRVASLGVKGYVSIDFLIDQAGQYYFTDPNVRRGGATSPTRIAERLGLTHWVNRLVATPEQTARELELDTCPLCYSPEKGEGIILSSAFTRQKKGVMLVCAPDRRPYWQREAAVWLQSDELRDAA